MTCQVEPRFSCPICLEQAGRDCWLHGVDMLCMFHQAQCQVGAFEVCSNSFVFLHNPSFIWLFFSFFQYFYCFSLVSLGHLQERQDGFKSCVALFNEGGHGRVNSTWLWPSILPIPQLSNQRHANAHAKYMLMYADDISVYMSIHISYCIILCWISIIILIYIALVGDRLLQHQAFYWVVFNLVWLCDEVAVIFSW